MQPFNKGHTISMRVQAGSMLCCLQVLPHVYNFWTCLGILLSSLPILLVMGTRVGGLVAG